MGIVSSASKPAIVVTMAITIATRGRSTKIADITGSTFRLERIGDRRRDDCDAGAQILGTGHNH
jgi:hypothetical protein